MKSRAIHTTLLCGLLLASSLTLSADDSKTAEAQALLDKAERLSKLTTKGSAPFTLDLTVERVTASGKVSATFTLSWAAEDRWRATVEDGNGHETHIRNAEGVWQPKLPNVTLAVFGEGAAFPFQRSLIRWDEKIKGLQVRKIDGTALPCVHLHRDRFDRELCINPTTGLLQRMSYRAWLGTPDPGSNLSEIPKLDAIIEYRDYAKFGEKWVPREIRTTVDGRLQKEIRLVRLSFDSPMPTEMFANPPEYEVWADCEHYDYAYISKIDILGTLDLRAKVADAVLVIVAPDGRAQEVRLVNPTGLNPKPWIDLLRKQHYQPASCDGKPAVGYFFLQLPIRQ